MAENSGGNICPQCNRPQTGKRNFCPYCGCSFWTEPVKTKPPAVETIPPIQPQIKPERREPAAPAQLPARPQRPPAVNRFRIVDRRVLFGILGMVDIPVIITLLVLLLWPRLAQPSAPSACEQLDLAKFTPERYERGIGGEMTEDTVFNADTEYLIQDTLVVPQGRRLLIQAGASLVFDEGIALDVYGKLYVCGSERKPVTFTSDKGEPGSWPGLRFYNVDEESVLSHVLVQFAGDRAIYLENSTPALLDVKIANSSGFPISSDGNALPKFLGDVDLDDNPFKGIEIRSGTVNNETVAWPNQGFVYVVSGPLEVGANTSLTIGPDVIIKFWHAPQGNPPGIGVRGLLKAEGAKFTSVYDTREEMGGATYLEARDPGPGDWVGIGFYESSGKSYLRRCLIQYAGQQQRGAVSMEASSPELSEVTIADGAWYPMSVDANSFPTLNNVILTDNDPGDAVEVRGGSTVAGREERTWEPLGDKTQIVRVIRGEVTVEPEATLTIEPGVVIKFEENGKLVIGGTLRAVGGNKDAERIVFTSLRDGDYGGDTDKATGPQDKRSWGGIVFDKADANSVLQNCIMRYASISLADASPRLIDNLITESESAGIWASPGASPELRGNQLEHNGWDGIAIWQAELKSDQNWPRIGEGDAQLIRILAGEITVVDGATLSIEPGTIIKVSSGGKLRIYGGLRTLGQADLPVVFTSLNDDSAGGDTNRKLEEAVAGDWAGLEVGANAQVYLGHTIIRYALNGLSLYGGNVPTIEGWLRVEDGKNALWCDSALRMPGSFQPEGNEVNEIQCPVH